MIDLATFLTGVVALFGLIAVDAGMHSNELYLTIFVPPKMADQGFTQPVAELQFLTESAATEEVAGLVRPPAVRPDSQHTLSSALAEPLHLSELTRAIQDYVGGRMVVTGTVIPDGKALKLAMVLSLPDGRLKSLTVTEQDGDPFKLMRRGANAALAFVNPARAIVVNFRRAITDGSPTMAEVRDQIEEELDKTGLDAKYQNRSILWTLRGTVAFFEGDQAMTARALDRALQSPDLLPQSRSVVYLDKAFLEVVQHQPSQALADIERSLANADAVDLPGYRSMIEVTRALAQWGSGQPELAKRTLQDLHQAHPRNVLVRHYLRLMTNQPDTLASDDSLPSDTAPTPFYPAVLPSVFWVDLTNWTVSRRTT